MKPSLITYILALLFWLTSLPLKTYSAVGSDGAKWQGLLNLLIGVLGLFLGVYAWLANPLFLLAAVTYFTAENKIVPFILAALGLLFALSFLFQKNIPIDEAGHQGEITTYHLGYWIWVLAMLCMTVACYIKMKNQ